MSKKDVAITSAKSAISLIPWAGGIINEVISYYQGKYVDLRVEKLEKILGDDRKDIFEKNMNNLNEQEYFLSRKLIKFYLLESEPIVSETVVKFLVDYILSNKRDSMNLIISMLCQMESSDIELLKKIKHSFTNLDAELKWEEISPYEVNNSDDKITKISLNQLISTDFSDDGNMNLEFNMMGIAFMKLDRLNIINTYFPIYPGNNNTRNITSFTITPLGKKIIEYID